MKVFEAAADALAMEGVETIFGLMGDGNMSLWSTIVARGSATIYSGRNEAGVIAMADGYFRATGDVGVATVTCGPGLTQIGTSLMAAARNRSALVVVTGEIPPHAINKLQSMDQRRFVELCCTRYLSVTGGPGLAREIAQAFYIARLESCPVVLNLRNDIQEEEFKHDWLYQSSQELLPDPAPAPAEEDVNKLYDALLAAERPIILAGRGARLSGAQTAIRDLAERTGALLGTSLQAKGMFSDGEWSVGIVGGYSSAVTEDICKSADLVIGVGAEIGHYTSWGGTLFPEAKVVRIDTAAPPDDIPAAPGLHVRADARKTVEAVLKAAEERQVRRTGYRTPETRRTLRQKPEPFPAPDEGLDPRALARRLGNLLPEDAMVTCGVGHFQGFVAMYMPVRPGTEMEFSSQFGAVGQTLPVALGIGVARPGRRHLVIEGDGSLMMNMQELETAARYGIPTVLVVWNDSGYGAEAQRLPMKGFSPEPAQWNSPDFVTLARAFGGDGVTLTDLADLDDAVTRGMKAEGLFVIDARVSKTETSDSYRKLYQGELNRTPLLA